MITHNKLRQLYLDYFNSKGHTVIPSAPLVPLNDPTVLFTTAGMHPLVPFLLGQEHPAGKRLCDVQKCIRTGDIDEVGDDFHLTYFEMLGNWSLGDYFKKEAIEMSYEFLTDKKWLGIPLEKLAFTCFTGDDDASRDQEAADSWKSLGVSEKRIVFLPKKDNWWGPAGQTGPCGPDTEMFYWVGEEPAPVEFSPDDKRWVEIWNDVFMQYNKTEEGKYETLKQKNVDTGMGLERTLAVLNGCSSVYETELFLPILNVIKDRANKYDEKKARVIADHIRSALFIIADGVEPSNKDRGYVLRRLIRRALVHARLLEMHEIWRSEVIEVIIKILGEDWPELVAYESFIIKTISDEADKFEVTLDKGLNEILRNKEADAFYYYQSYGLPLDIIKEFIPMDEAGVEKFESDRKKHQDLSRTASAGQFKGGLADNSEIITRYHTATHLMNAALRKVLGEHVMQKGSNITAERTRFDFSHSKKMTDQEKAKVEEMVNDWIERDLNVVREEMSQEKARELNAIGAFGEKYGDIVSVYTVIDEKSGELISREFCGGPHITHTSEIGKFKILKEEAVSAGVRRIKATIG